MVELLKLETERLILRKFESKDASDLFEYCSDEETVKYVTFPRYHSMVDSIDRISDLTQKYKTHEIMCWAIELKETGKVIGSIDFVNYYDSIKCVEIGYILNNAFWNKGYITEAAACLTKYAFEQLKMVRVQAKCIAENLGSSRVMEKIGMKFEGCLRKSTYRNERYYDVNYFAILDEEYQNN